MRVSKDCWIFTKPIAHRGLWGNGVIENSVTAYQLASSLGYPIEIDIYQTIDGHLVSFHDKELFRMTGKEGLIYNKTLKELKELNLLNSNEKIPTFDEVLQIVEGKSPLLIEIKDQPSKTVVLDVVNRLKNYNGEFAIQSFNPLYIRKVKKLAPKFIRGILGTVTHGKQESAFNKFFLKNLPLNFLLKPDFISYSFEDLPLKKCIKKNIPVIAWTVTDQETERLIAPYAKNIIFENYVPIKYKTITLS